MIASVNGEISQILDGQVVVNLSGLGLLINVTENTCLNCHLGMPQPSTPIWWSERIN